MSDEALVQKLQEWKNPLFLSALGLSLSLVFYFKEISLKCLFISIFVFLICILFTRGIKLFILSLAVLFGYFYCFVYFKFFVVNLEHFLNERKTYLGEILTIETDSALYYKKYFLNIKEIIGEPGIKTNIWQKSKVLVIGSPYEEYSPGDFVQVSGILKKPKKALLPGLFDEKRYLLGKGVHYILKAEPGSLVFLDEPKENFFKKIIYETRKEIILSNAGYLFPVNANLVNGIVLGSKANKLKNNLREKIRSLGLSHITAASGFNVSILSFSIFWLLRLFYKGKLLPTVISITAVLFYGALADFSASITRAAIFTILVLVGSLYDKKPKLLGGVGLIVVLFFLFDPVSLLDIGLQLSVFSFLGIMLFITSAESKVMHYFTEKAKWLVSIVLQSFFAQIMVIPLIVFYFHNIQLYGLVSNIIAVPLAAIILITGLLAGVICLVSLLFPPIGYINIFFYLLLSLFSNLFLCWINLLDKMPLKQVFIPNVNSLFILFIYISIVYVLSSLFIESFRKKLIVFLFIFVICFIGASVLDDSKKYMKIFCIKKYNKDQVLIIPPASIGNPVLVTSNKLNKNDARRLNEFLRLNNIHEQIEAIDLLGSINSKSIPYIINLKNKITVKYNDYTFELIKTYDEKITGGADCVKLPLLKKSDPALASVFESFPDCLIVNDYKRLSKKSVNDIKWLKSNIKNAFFVSETGTIALFSDGKGKNKILAD